MEHMPPPPPSTTQISSGQTTCLWCNQPMPAEAIKCPSCGKLRKDIYNQKIICYLACGLGGLLLGISIIMLTKKRQVNIYDYYNGNTGGGGHAGAWVMLVLGIAAAAYGIWIWIKISQKLKTYIWV